MTTDIATLGIKVDSSQAAGAAKNLDDMAAAGGRAESAMSKMQRQVDGILAPLRNMQNLLAGIAAALAVQKIIEYADSWKLIEGRLRLVTKSTQDLLAVQDALYRMAQRTRTSYEGTAELFARVARASDQLGASQAQVLRFTELTQKAIQTSGASAQEAASGVIQLGQALASGTLRGDELRSVLENLSGLAIEIAAGMGTTVGQLRKLAEEGKLTSEAVFKAVLARSKEIEERFGTVPLTVGQGLTVVTNAVQKFIGQVDGSLGATAALSAGLLHLAGGLDQLTTDGSAASEALAAVGFGLGSAGVGGALVFTLPLLKAATTAVVNFGVALLSNPITAIPTLFFAAGAAAFYYRKELLALLETTAQWSDLATAAYDMVNDRIDQAIGWVGRLVRSGEDWVEQMLGVRITAGEAFDLLVAGFQAAGSMAIDFANATIKTFASIIPVVMGLARTIVATLEAAFLNTLNVAKAFKTDLGEIFDGDFTFDKFEAAVSGSFDRVTEAGEREFQVMAEALGRIWKSDPIRDLAGGVRDSLRVLAEEWKARAEEIGDTRVMNRIIAGYQEWQASMQAATGLVKGQKEPVDSLTSAQKTFAEELKREAALIGASNLQRKVADNLVRAGLATSEQAIKIATGEVAVTDARVRSIIELTRQLHAQRAAEEALKISIERATDLAEEDRKAREKSAEFGKTLIDEKIAYVAGVEREIRQQDLLTEAVGRGEQAYRVTAKALELMRANTLLNQDEATRLAERVLASEDAFTRVRSTATELSNFLGQTFERVGSAITEAFAKGEISALKAKDVIRGVASEVGQWFAKLAFLNPVKNALSGGGGTLPTLFSLFGQAGGSGAPAAGGAAPATGASPLSGVGGFFNSISSAISTGFSSVTTGINSFLFGTAGGAANAAGVGAIAGGLSNAPAAGLLGTYGTMSLSSIMPYVGIAMAALSLFGGSLFGGQPSVGPTSVGRITDLSNPASAVYTFDNGGSDKSAVSEVIKAVTEAIDTATMRFVGTLKPGSGFDFGYFPKPEEGTQPGGFNIKPIINNVLESDDRVKGLTGQKAIEEATRIALAEMVDYASDTLDQIAKNSDATDLSGLMEALEYGRDFDLLRAALGELGDGVEVAQIGLVSAMEDLGVDTLAAAKQIAATNKAATDFATANAKPITDFLEKALEYFPASTTREETVSETVRGVFLPSGPEGDGGRFVEEGSTDFDRYTTGDNALPIVERVNEVARTVTAASADYAGNLTRVADAVRIATADTKLLVDTITGEFEPAVKGPFQAALEQGSANLRALAPEFERTNDQIRAAYQQFPELTARLGPLSDALIDVTGTIDTALVALRSRLQKDWTRSIQDILDPSGAQNRQLGDWFEQQIAEIRSLWGMQDASLSEVLATDAGQMLIQAYTKQLSELNDMTADYVSTLEAEADTVQRAIDKHQALGEAMETIADDLLRHWRSTQTGDLSPISARNQLDFASTQWTAALAASQGDPALQATQDAMRSLPGLQTEYLQAARAYYGESAAYFEIFTSTQAEMEKQSNRAASLAEQHFAEARRQTDILTGIQTKIDGVAANDNQPLYVQGGDGQYVATGRGGLPAGFDLGRNAAQNMAIYLALKAAGLNTPSGFGEGQLGSVRQQSGASAIIDAIDARYADGGISYGPQLAMVSEGRYRAEAHVPLPNGRSIPVEFSGSSGGGGDNVALLDEVRQLRAEVRGLRSSMDTQNAALGRAYGDFTKVSKRLDASGAMRGKLRSGGSGQ